MVLTELCSFPHLSGKVYLGWKSWYLSHISSSVKSGYGVSSALGTMFMDKEIPSEIYSVFSWERLDYVHH